MAGRLIAIEGLPGSGKSTMSQALALAFADAGIPARWYSELEVDHPLERAYQPDKDRTIEEFVSLCRPNWLHFLNENISSGQKAVIVEGRILQNQVFSCLLSGIERETIVAAMEELVGLLPPQETTLIYLTQGDVARAVEHACGTRGDRMRAFYINRNDKSRFAASRGVSGMAGLVRFWSEHRAICDEILDRAGVSCVVKDVSAHDWERVTGDILKHFGLEPPDPSKWNTDLQRFTGTYVLDEQEGKTFQLVLERGKLLALCPTQIWTTMVRQWHREEQERRSRSAFHWTRTTWPR